MVAFLIKECMLHMHLVNTLHGVLNLMLKDGKGKPAAKQAAAAAAPVSAPAKEALTNKLAFSKSLRTALLTHTGLSNDLFEKIWDQSCKDSGNA